MKTHKKTKSVTFEADKQIFTSYLESVSGTIKPYTTEVTRDKLLIKCRNQIKVKLEFDLRTIAIFQSYEKVDLMVSN